MSLESVMLANHLILCHPLLLPSVFPSIRVFSNKLALHIRWPEYWSFSFSISPSHENLGLVSYRIIGLISLQSRGISRVFSSTTVRKHQLFGTQPSLWSKTHSHPYMTTGKTILWLYRPLSAEVMSLIFSTFSRLVIAFLPRSKHLLISWL